MVAWNCLGLCIDSPTTAFISHFDYYYFCWLFGALLFRVILCPLLCVCSYWYWCCCGSFLSNWLTCVHMLETPYSARMEFVTSKSNLCPKIMFVVLQFFSCCIPSFFSFLFSLILYMVLFSAITSIKMNPTKRSVFSATASNIAFCRHHSCFRWSESRHSINAFEMFDQPFPMIPFVMAKVYNIHNTIQIQNTVYVTIFLWATG